MLSPDHDPGYRSICSKLLVCLAVVALCGAAGCHCGGNSCAGTCGSQTQLHFYAPPGAMVEIQALGSNSSRQILPPGAFGDRLERTPEEACVFNLSPGCYEFKYTAAEGVPGAAIYGELDVHHANGSAARIFQRRSAIPIALPSEYYRNVEARGDELVPYRGEGYRTAIDERDIVRVKAGDVVEKVFVVADLAKADRLLQKTEVEIAAAEREIEYAEARFREAYYDFRTDVSDSSANFWGTDRKFIRWEKKRQRAQQNLDKLIALRQRTQSLIKADHVIIRDGMLVVATQEVVRPYRDVVGASQDIGEVLLVMRLGGRHMQWGEPPGELAAYKP